ncbi:peroxisomal biogenesis factor 2 [Colletotrichum sojae]|uniref:Peroxisomal biogenesis factor 2 n=1 Tax=Colletotrichum sojae TaxID=2175907 RepID=A0A8H6JY34_9PEZI|nr:peroxisomal biogenesis factor 2 [Colletotrichum sojae]
MTSTNFAQAQQRLAARRQAREADNAARLVAQNESSRARAQIDRLPFPFSRLGSAWDAVSSQDGTRPAFRVGQVDAELLDDELLELLRGQVGDALKYFAGGHLKDDWSAEILLALRAVLFKLTVWDHDATYGAALQNLKYTDARKDGSVLVAPSRWQKSLYGLATVVGRYGWDKWENWLLERDDGYSDPSPRLQRLSRVTSRITTLHAGAAFISFLVFLLQGRYRTLLDRVLRMRLAPPTSQVSREVSFEYLNRQLVWHAFTEFLLFVLPLIGINRWRRWISRTWRKTKQIMTTSGDDEKSADGEYGFLPERTCAICYQDQNAQATTETEIMAAAASSGVIGSAQTDITNPYETIPCGCVYCFVCLATRLEREEGEGWTCLRCGELVKECKPWSGDVLEPPKKSPTSKVVAFSEDAKITEEQAVVESEDDDEGSNGADFVDVPQEREESSESTDTEDSEGFEETMDNDED